MICEGNRDDQGRILFITTFWHIKCFTTIELILTFTAFRPLLAPLVLAQRFIFFAAHGQQLLNAHKPLPRQHTQWLKIGAIRNSDAAVALNYKRSNLIRAAYPYGRRSGSGAALFTLINIFNTLTYRRLYFNRIFYIMIYKKKLYFCRLFLIMM